VVAVVLVALVQTKFPSVAADQALAILLLALLLPMVGT
jgi:hypothetical protein